jgi:hypothetical protein
MYYASSESPIIPVSPLWLWGPNDPRPTLPIAGWKPDGTWGDAHPTPPPLDIWGPNDPRPSVPIAEPPWGWGGTPPPLPQLPNFKVTYMWTAELGWMVVAIPQGPVVTPS